MIKTMTKCRKNAKFTKRENSRLTKNIFSGFLNWILGHLQSSDDENKIAIREISIRAIQKLSYCDQQTIVDGPNFNLTNGKISYIFSLFFRSFHFCKKIPFCYKFALFSNYFHQKNAFLYFFIVQFLFDNLPYSNSRFSAPFLCLLLVVLFLSRLFESPSKYFKICFSLIKNQKSLLKKVWE